MNELARLYKEQDIIDAKIDILIESIQHRHEVTLSKAENFILTEGGTSRDLINLYEEAEADLEKKTRSVLGKIKDALIKFFKKIGEVISNFFSTKGDKDIEDAQEQMKNNPFFKRSKIIVPNTDAIVKVCEDHEKPLKKLIGKVKAGQTVSNEEIDTIESSFLEKHTKAIAVGTTVTVAAAIGILIGWKKKWGKKTQAEITDIEQIEKALATVKMADDKDKNGESVRAKLFRTVGEIKKVAVKAGADGVRDLSSNIKNASKSVTAKGSNAIKKVVNKFFKKKNNDNVDETIVEENVNMLDFNDPDIYDSALNESYDLLDDVYDEYYDDGYSNTLYESYDNYDELDEFLESFNDEGDNNADIGTRHTYTETAFFDPEDLDDDPYYTTKKPISKSEIISDFDTGLDVEGYPSKKSSSAEVIRSMYQMFKDNAKDPFK